MGVRVVGVWTVCLLVSVGTAVADDHRLVDAAKQQDEKAVAALLKQGADVNAPQNDGTTALHWAAYQDDITIATILIRAGAKVNAANDLGVTPLSLAAANGSALMVEKLLGAGANPKAQPAREPPLMLASRVGSIAAVRALLIRGADVNARDPLRGQTALMWAVAQGHVDVAKTLIEAGASVSARSLTSRLVVNRGGAISSTNEESPSAGEVEKGGSTPLLFAARVGSVESARLLLDAGADVNETAPDGNSALVMAAHSGHGKLAQFLLDRGADPNASGSGYAALHTAVLTGDIDLVKALIAHGADLNARLTRGTPVRRTGEDLILPESLMGATPFFLAAKFVDSTLLRVLLTAGADASVPLRNGTTPLMAAAGLGWSGSTNRRGVDVTANKAARDPRDGEPFTLEAVRLVIEELGANVNQTNDAGDTALFGAVGKGFTTVVQYLAEKGANLEAKNKRGQTPLMLTVPRLTGAADTPPEALIATGALLRKLGATP